MGLEFYSASWKGNLMKLLKMHAARTVHKLFYKRYHIGYRSNLYTFGLIRDHLNQRDIHHFTSILQ